MCNRNIFYSFLLIISLTIGPLQGSVAAVSQRKVGMWYSTLYSNDGDYLWTKGHAVGSTDRFIADVNKDGKDDIVFFYNGGGVWHTLLSTGNGFQYGGATNQFGEGSSKRFVADVNGDNCADAVAYWHAAGNWRVWESDCAGRFKADNTIRIYGHGVGSMTQLMGDINGDKRADAIIVTPQGDWHGGTSNGYNFGYPNFWKTGHGAGSQFKHFLENVDSDARADAVVYDGGTGKWYVSLNNGVIHQAQPHHGEWRTGFGVGKQLMMGRADNNATNDIIAYDGATGGWYISETQGFKFNEDVRTTTPRITGHGNSAKLQAYSKGGASWVGVGDLNGDGIEEAVTFHDRGVNGQDLGEWRVLTLREHDGDYSAPGYWNAKYSSPDQFNYWQSNLIGFKPIINGVAKQYKTTDTVVIDSHLAKMVEAKIDYLLFDLTNGVGWVEDNAVKVCQRMVLYNQTHQTNLRFAVAQGSGQYHYGAPDKGVGKIEADADTMYRKFIADYPDCGSIYFQWKGKPLLVNMFINVDQVKLWEQTANKLNTSRFTVRYTLGSVPYNAFSEPYPSKSGQGCGTIPTNVRPWPAEWGYYAGWGMPWGSLPNNSIMVAMPGWYVHSGPHDANNKRVSRTQFGVQGRFYSECGWDRIVNQKPEMAVINSFNEFAEESAIEPSDTSQLTGYSERWASPNMYWNMTKTYVNTYKN